MPNPLTPAQEKLHARALHLIREQARVQWQLVEVLQGIDQCKLYQKLQCSSLFQYAVEILGLSEALAYSFISVSRKASQISPLQVALQEKSLSISKAARLVSVITLENADELIGFAKQHSFREIDKKVVQLNPRSVKRDSRLRFITPEKVELTITLNEGVLNKLKRVQSLLAQKNQESSLAHAMEAALDEFLYRKDPVQKAKRAINSARAEKIVSTESTLRPLALNARPLAPLSQKRRRPLSARQKHQVFARDGGRCTHMGSNGKRCENDRWIALHHIHPISLGGTNEPENLTTLCWYHHDLVHQQSLPLEGEVSWLKSPKREYRRLGPDETIHVSTFVPRPAHYCSTTFTHSCGFVLYTW